MTRRNRNPRGTQKDSLQSDIDNATIQSLSRRMANSSVGRNSTPGFQRPQPQEFTPLSTLSVNDPRYPAPFPVPDDPDCTRSSAFDVSNQGPMAEPATIPFLLFNQQDCFSSWGPLIQIPPNPRPALGSGQSRAQGMQPVVGVAQSNYPQWPQSASIQQPGGPQSGPGQVAIMTGPNNRSQCVTVTIEPHRPFSFISARLAIELGCDIIPCPPSSGESRLATFGFLPVPQYMASGISIEPQWGQFPYSEDRVTFLVDIDDLTINVVLGQSILQRLQFGPDSDI